jgi:hypothetical protein
VGAVASFRQKNVGGKRGKVAFFERQRGFWWVRSGFGGFVLRKGIEAKNGGVGERGASRFYDLRRKKSW